MPARRNSRRPPDPRYSSNPCGDTPACDSGTTFVDADDLGQIILDPACNGDAIRP
jgi:hypothetical protein